MREKYKKYNLKEVQYIVKDIGFELVSDIYVNNDKKLVFKDYLGYYYETNLNKLLIGQMPRLIDIRNSFNLINIHHWVELNNKTFKLISTIYNGSKNNLQWKCLNENCGEIFKMCWDNIFHNYGCPYCSGRKVGLLNCLATLNPKLSTEWYSTLNGDLTPYDVTCGSKKDVWWLCKQNPKHIWMALIKTRNAGCGCPYCDGLYASEDNNLLQNNPELCKEWDYNKNTKLPSEYTPKTPQKVWWICGVCNYNWDASICHRNNGSGCPQCNESKGEKKIEKILNKYNIYNITQYTFPDCKYKQALQFDSYLPNYNTCIEYQGIQHYEPVDFAGRGQKWAEQQFELNQKRDQIKRDYCNKNNIKLIEIPYWDFDNIEKILEKELNINRTNGSENTTVFL